MKLHEMEAREVRFRTSDKPLRVRSRRRKTIHQVNALLEEAEEAVRFGLDNILLLVA